MTLTLSSIFRDSTGYLDRYFAQVEKLEAAVGDDISLVIAEGDSTDDTYDALAARMRPQDTLLKIDHGGRKFGSIDNPERWAQIALVCNGVMEEAASHLGPKIYVESDLIWEPRVMERLLEDLAVYPAVAPLSLRFRHGTFYDVWGHRGLDGQAFTQDQPFHADLAKTDSPLVEIGSAGSCVVMREEVQRVARFGENDCIVGLGREIRHRAEASLWLDRRVAVYHP